MPTRRLGFLSGIVLWWILGAVGFVLTITIFLAPVGLVLVLVALVGGIATQWARRRTRPQP